MAKKEQIHFRKWIKEIGIGTAAKILGTTYECCRAYVSDKGYPSREIAKKMYKESKGRIDPVSFFK